MLVDYKEPPLLDPNDFMSKTTFPDIALEYLEGVKSDLEEIEAKADNAAKRAKAVSDMIAFDTHFPQQVQPAYLFGKQSNFTILSMYPEFPNFNYLEPIQPIRLYGLSYETYKKAWADYMATINDYIEDAKHYVRNAQNDYNMVRKKGQDYISYLENLSKKGADLDITYD